MAIDQNKIKTTHLPTEDRYGSIILRRIKLSDPDFGNEVRHSNVEPTLLAEDLATTPYEVVKRWIEGRYLLRPLPGTGYRYTGLFLGLCGYYKYESRDSSQNEKTKGVIRIYLENGEIALAGVRTEAKKNHLDEKIKFRSLFSSLYQSPEGTSLCFVYGFIPKFTELKNCQNAIQAIDLLKKCTLERESTEMEPNGALELNVGNFERSLISSEKGRDTVHLSYKHIQSA